MTTQAAQTVTALRSQIDSIDAELVQLISRRASTALKIGQAKRDSGDDVYDPNRERSVLDKIDGLNTGPLDKGALEEVFAAIMTVCRELQGRTTS